MLKRRPDETLAQLLTRLDQAIERVRRLDPIRQTSSSSQGHTTQRPLRGVVVDLEVAIFYIARESIPA